MQCSATGLGSSVFPECSLHAVCSLRFPSGVVLHEEHIELLTADFKQLKKDIAGKKLEEGSLHFTGQTSEEPEEHFRSREDRGQMAERLGNQTINQKVVGLITGCAK